MNKKRILNISIERMEDSSPDTSWLGSYSNTAEYEFTIDRRHSLDCASVNPANLAAVEQLERAIHHLNMVRYNLPNDAPDYEFDDVAEAQDILTESQEQVTECDCDHNRIYGHLRNEYQYFNPGSIEAFNADASWIPADVTDKRAYWSKTMRENALKDYKRMEAYNNGDFSFIGIRAEAEVQFAGFDVVQTITSGGLWGIESDSDVDYLKSVESEELAALKDTLHKAGFSKRAIAKAIKDANL